MVWARLNAFWFSKDDPVVHSKGKRRRLDRRRGGKTILKSGQEWSLPGQLGQLKKDKVDRGYCEVIRGAPTTF